MEGILRKRANDKGRNARRCKCEVTPLLPVVGLNCQAVIFISGYSYRISQSRLPCLVCLGYDPFALAAWHSIAGNLIFCMMIR